MDQAAQTLLSDFGRFVEIEGLVFDENGYVSLSFDDIALSIEHMDDRGELLVYADVGEVPPIDDGELFGKLLATNHAAAAGGLGTLGLNRASGQFVYLDRVALRGLTQQQFQDVLKNAIDRVEFWRGALKGPFLLSKAQNGGEQPGMPNDLSAMIRI